MKVDRNFNEYTDIVRFSTWRSCVEVVDFESKYSRKIGSIEFFLECTGERRNISESILLRKIFQSTMPLRIGTLSKPYTPESDANS